MASALASHALGHRFEPGLAQCHLDRQAMIGIRGSFELCKDSAYLNNKVASRVAPERCCREICTKRRVRCTVAKRHGKKTQTCQCYQKFSPLFSQCSNGGGATALLPYHVQKIALTCQCSNNLSRHFGGQ